MMAIFFKAKQLKTKQLNFWRKNLIAAQRWTKQIYPNNRALFSLFIVCLFSLLICGLGFIFDNRQINGEFAWIKPTKFSLSFLIYSVTMIWLSQFIERDAHFFKWSCNAALVGATIELLGIITQVIRGTTSHFNTSTCFDHGVFILVKIAIVPVALAVLVSFILMLRQKDLPPVLDSALHWGLFLTLVGCVPAILMILPDPLQDSITRYQQFDGHTVGLAEGGPGLPWLGWSTVAGDLRGAHFLGIHALQIMPIIGLSIKCFLPKLGIDSQKAIIWIIGFSYLSIIVVMTWQALRAESMFQPSRLTLLIVSSIFGVSSLLTCVAFALPSKQTLKHE